MLIKVHYKNPDASGKSYIEFLVDDEDGKIESLVTNEAFILFRKTKNSGVVIVSLDNVAAIESVLIGATKE